METKYYQFRIVDGVKDMDGNKIIYNNGYHVLEGGTFQVCQSEATRMIARMKDLVSAGILTNAFVKDVENHLNIVNC
jgi:hypothetical protein